MPIGLSASAAPLNINFVSDFTIKSAFWPKNFSSPAAGLKGLRLACGGFATLASTIIPVTSGEGVTSQGARGSQCHPPRTHLPPLAHASLSPYSPTQLGAAPLAEAEPPDAGDVSRPLVLGSCSL